MEQQLGMEGESSRGLSDSGSVDLPPLPGAAHTLSSSPETSRRGSVLAPPGASPPAPPPPLLPGVLLQPVDAQRLLTLTSFIKAEVGGSALDCCSVFKNEILEDFPAQTFLQNCHIIESLMNLVESSVKDSQLADLTIAALQCLLKVAKKLAGQLHKYQDPNMVASCEEAPGWQEGRSWSLLEFVWAILQTSAFCLRASDNSAVLVETLALLQAGLKLHARFFPQASLAEQLRLSSLLAEAAASRPPTFAYLQLLHLMKDYVERQPIALGQCESLMGVLKEAAVSAGIWCLNPELAQQLLAALRVTPVKDAAYWKFITSLTKMCQAIVSANHMISFPHITADEQTLEEAALSLDFLADARLVQALVEGAARGQGPPGADVDVVRPGAAQLVLGLLAHPSPKVQLQSYQSCLHVLGASIGTGQAKNPCTFTPDNMAFLCDDKVLQEIVCFGLKNDNPKVRALAEDIMVQVLGCRMLVSPMLWAQVSSCLALLSPLLASCCNSSKRLQGSLLSLFNPESHAISAHQIVRGNACLLFSRDEALRREATTRLLWTVERHPERVDKWPQTLDMNIDSASITSLCIINEPIIISNNTSTFYNEASLGQIVSLLEPASTESGIRHSALCQLAAMLHEERLAPAFLERGGVEVCVRLLDSALLKSNTEVLSKSVKPIVTVLACVLCTNANLRHQLSQDETLLLNLIRAMFLYSSTDVDFKQHLSALLSLLLFSDLLRQRSMTQGSSSLAECLLLPQSMLGGLVLPLAVGSYARFSSQAPQDLVQLLTCLAGPEGGKNLSLLLRCHYTLEKIGTLRNLQKVLDLGELSEDEARGLLRYDAAESVLCALSQAQAATTHAQVCSALAVVASYQACPRTHPPLPWRETFARFIASPPANQADCDLLESIAAILTEEGADWISCKDVLAQLVPQDLTSAQTFIPLLRCSLCSISDDAVVWEVANVLWRCLVGCESPDSVLTRQVLGCLLELTRDSSTQLGPRLTAELIAALVELVCQFNLDGSFVGLGLVESALQCLCLIQATNLRDFFIHFCAYSESSNILDVLLLIASSDKTVAKASSLSLLAGLAKDNNAKNHHIDLNSFVQKSLSLALDRNETCLVRKQATVLLSCVCTNQKLTPDTGCFIELLEEKAWFEQCAEMFSHLYLEPKFVPTHNESSSLSSYNSSLAGFNFSVPIVSPELLSSNLSLLHNLIIAEPALVNSRVKTSGMLGHTIDCFSRCLEFLAASDAPRPQVCHLLAQLANFIANCLIIDNSDDTAMELEKYPYWPHQVLSILKLNEFPLLATSTFKLMVALVQAELGSALLSAFQQGVLWEPLCSALANQSSREQALMLARALALEAKGCSQGSASADQGAVQLCEALMRELRCEESHQAAMAALAGLLAGWPSTRHAALEQGLLESVMMALRQCLAGLLLVQDPQSLATSSARVHPLIEELVDTFELLVGLMHEDTDVKKAVSDTSLAADVSKMWPVCLNNKWLLGASIKLLLVYTAGCEDACSTLLHQGATKRSSSSNSLLHHVATLANSSLADNHDLARQALVVLKQCCTSADCRAALVKTSLITGVCTSLHSLHPGVQLTVLALLESLTRHSLGNHTIARIPEAMEALCVLASEREDKVGLEKCVLASEILKNFCFHPDNRVLVLNSRLLQSCFQHILTEAGPERVRLVGAALWALAATHKGKQALRAAGFQERLTAAKQRCLASEETKAALDSALKSLAA